MRLLPGPTCGPGTGRSLRVHRRSGGSGLSVGETELIAAIGDLPLPSSHDLWSLPPREVSSAPSCALVSSRQP
jgi:hypothetical protein